MKRPYQKIGTTIALLGVATTAQAAWVNLVNQTATRMPTGAGQNVPAVTTTDPKEKDYAWGDVDRDGDTDMVVVRKVPFTNPGGERGVLFMNENGLLIDRASTLANTAINVPGAQGVSQGMLDQTNDRDVVLADVDNDGWLDIITCTTISDTLPAYRALPRVYMNNGSSGGVWQGFTYDFGRIPQMLSAAGNVAMPRFCSVACADITGDGYSDLYFGDYDSSGAGGSAESPANDYNNKLLINLGAANPGFFVDESTLRMNNTLLLSAFGAASVITDINGDGIKDVVKQTSLNPPQHVATLVNNPANVGFFTTTGHEIQNSLAPYFVSTGDLNGDNKLDMVVTDDNADRYYLNTGNDANNNPNFSNFVFAYGSGGDDGFGSQSVITDLDNDGWRDVLIANVDVDIGPCAPRRLHIFQNNLALPPPNNNIKEASPVVIPNVSTYNVAAFDIDSDGWKDLVIGGCTTTIVYMQTPQPGITFSYPGGHPSTLTPDAAENFQVQINGIGGGTLVAGSAKLNVSLDGAAFVQTNLADLGGGLFQATLPATACPSNLRYYISGQVGSKTFTDPKAAVGYYSAYAASNTQVALSDDFEASSGWTVTSDGSLTGGAWALADPVGTWNEGVRAAPEDDHSPVGTMAFVTQNGSIGGTLSAADVDGGATFLVSPTIDLGGSNATVSLSYWMYSSHHADALKVEVSNNDSDNWALVRNNIAGPDLGQANTYIAEPNSWKDLSFVVGDYVSPTSQVKVRITASDVAPASIVEAGIDDFLVTQFICEEPKVCSGDTNGDNNVDVDDLLTVINGWGATSGPADVNGDSIVNVDDLLVVINAWGACQ